jgi:hypothetical protein
MTMRSLLKTVTVASAVAALSGQIGGARAAGPTDQATAVALFQEARKLVDAGDFERACPKFAEAQKLLPTPGTALSLGDCYERGGKLASAWGAFKQAEFFARGTGANDHQAEAQRRAAALAPKLARLALVVPPAAKVAGFEVRRDGDAVGEAQWGSPVPIDTGWHKIEATAPGRRAWSTQVRIEADGASASVNVPMLEVTSRDTPAGTPFWSGRRIFGVVIGGAGLVGLGVAGGFAARAAAKNAESKQNCSPADPNFCDDVGVSLRKDAKTAAAVSTAATIVGATVLAGGIVLFATASSAKPTKAGDVEVVARMGGLTVQGRF